MHGCEENLFLLEKWWGLCSVSKIQIWRVLCKIFQDPFSAKCCQSKNEKPKGHKWNTYSEFVTFIEVLLHFILYLFMVQWNCRYDGTIQRKSKRGKIWKKNLNIRLKVILLQALFSWEKGAQTK